MGKPFSKQEIEFVRDMYPIMTSREIAERIGRPNPKSIRNLASQLGVTKEPRWTAREKRILETQYGHCDLRWLCDRLNRSRWSVMHMVRRLGLQRDKTWTAEDDAVLRDRLPTDDLFAVARDLGTTVWAVRGRCQRIGIRKIKKPSVHKWVRHLGHKQTNSVGVEGPGQKGVPGE